MGRNLNFVFLEDEQHYSELLGISSLHLGQLKIASTSASTKFKFDIDSPLYQ